MLTIHLAVLAAVLVQPASPKPKPVGVEAMVLKLIAARPPVLLPLPPPTLPDVRDPVDALIPAQAPAIEIATKSTGPVWSAGACAPLAAIGGALATDPGALAAIAALPSGLRSDSGAVALWNGVWVEAAAPDAPLAPVRAMVERALASAPADCLDLIELGPRLVIVAAAARPTLLVLGSGAWRWRDLTQNPAKRGV